MRKEIIRAQKCQKELNGATKRAEYSSKEIIIAQKSFKEVERAKTGAKNSFKV